MVRNIFKYSKCFKAQRTDYAISTIYSKYIHLQNCNAVKNFTIMRQDLNACKSNLPVYYLVNIAFWKIMNIIRPGFF